MKKNKGHYLGRFRYHISINDNGVPGECMNWCEKNCKGKWGWFFEPINVKNDEHFGKTFHSWNYEDQEAFMSFTHKRDAVRFWFENIKVMSEQKG